MPIEIRVTGPGLCGTQPRFLALADTDGAMESAMTFRIADIGNEAQLVELGERLSKALSSAQHRTDMLNFSPEYLDAAKTMLAELSEEIAVLPSRAIPLIEQQVETFLDFDPVFLDMAKDMLRAFIERTEGMGVHNRR
jgi:hypothetical protein